MRCPVCGGKTKVVDVRERGKELKRRRECLDCLVRFNTKEVVLWKSIPEYVLKKMQERDNLIV